MSKPKTTSENIAATDTEPAGSSVSTGVKAAKSAPEKLPMDDGTTQDFTARQRMLKTATLQPDGTISVKLYFRNGRALSESFGPSNPIYAKAAAHGFLQKLGDECAGVDSLDDMVQAVEELIARLNNGEWKGRRESGGSAAGGSILAKALVEFTGKTPEQIKEFLSNKSGAEKTALRNNSKIRVIIERLEAERAAKHPEKVLPDADALLSEIM